MSMRSALKNVPDLGEVVIIGYCPPWLDANKIRFIPWGDPWKENKDANILGKIIAASCLVGAPDLVIMCDDYIILHPIETAALGHWHGGHIPSNHDPNRTKWQTRLVETGHKLRRAGKTDFNFDQHLPMRLLREWCVGALNHDFISGRGMTTFSTILNAADQPGEKLVPGIKAYLDVVDMTEEEVLVLTLSHQFATLGENAPYCPAVTDRLNGLFSEPAPWEIY